MQMIENPDCYISNLLKNYFGVCDYYFSGYKVEVRI